MQVSDEEVTKLVSNSLQSMRNIFPEFDQFSFTPRTIPDSDSGGRHSNFTYFPLRVSANCIYKKLDIIYIVLPVVAMFGMFEDLGMISRWRIARDSLARFILLVRRGYR